MEEEVRVGGTLIWYYCICPRQVWLMSHQLTPDEDQDALVVGRAIGETAYQREKKELAVGGSRIDVFHADEDGLVIGEVKKSSRFKESARLQLALYLSQLKERGIAARGELRFPQERLREEVVLTEELERQLVQARADILRLVRQPQPPAPKKISFCKPCAYCEFCWC